MPHLLRVAFPALTLSLAAFGCRAQPEEGMIRPEASAHPPVAAPARPAGGAHPGAQGESWNAQQIDWQGYEAGLAKAKAEKKPVVLVFYTNWCPHCRNYSHVFDDPTVVDQSKKFVMIRANADEEADLANRFRRDGGYVPRTFFLKPDGTLDPDIHVQRPKFLYFFDEKDPRSLLGGMDEALRKLTG